jgi:Mg-chelatase subunit ChlD
VTRQAAGQDDAIPQGLLGLALRDHRGRLPEASRLLATAALTTEGQSLAYALPAAALAQRGPQLQAVALLRGHEFTAPSLLRMLGGVRIEFARHPAVDPQVTLYGARRKQPSLMFVLDCSHSMETPMTLEVPNGAPAVPTTRLDVAKGALQTMLERLAQRPEQRVGVRFYGHRVGWNLKQASEVLVQKDYPRPVATDLSPSEDVELVLPLGRFDQLAAGTVTRLLRKVTPWGETPLYLALVQAVQDFTLDRPDTEKSMVVITDGINNQFNPQPEAAKSLRDVLTARGGRPIRIHIVGFGIPENEREQAVREFHELAVATDGSYHLATGVDSLLRRLEELLGFGEYSVVAASGELVGRRVVDQPVPVAPLPQPGDYRVQWQSLEEPIRLEGGEALELEIDAPTRGLLSLRYERGAPVFRPLVSGTPPAPTGVNFCVHQPLAKARQVRFHFSFQRADRHFTARPAEVWIEVTPQHRRGLRSYPKYIFYDVNYEPRTRVPVLEWTAAQWPDEAEQAEVRVWGRMTKIPPTVVVALADVADRVPEHGEGHPLSAVPGVTYQVRTQRGAARDEALYRVSLLERHGAGSTGVDALKVELVPAAQRIRHQFDAENRLVLHTFDYHLPEGEIPENLAIHFTTRAALQSEAWLPDEPAVVGVAAQDDLLPLTAPSSSGRATSSP